MPSAKIRTQERERRECNNERIRAFLLPSRTSAFCRALGTSLRPSAKHCKGTVPVLSSITNGVSSLLVLSPQARSWSFTDDTAAETIDITPGSDAGLEEGEQAV